MMPSVQRYEFSWRRPHLVVILAVLTTAAALIAYRAHGRQWFADTPAVDTRRAAAASELIDPNRASAASLQRLSLIGPVTAQAIVEYRASHGGSPFRRPEDLKKVLGIGPGVLLRIAPYLKFETNQQQH